MYQVVVRNRVLKKLSKISEPYYSALKTAILHLEENPRPQGYKKLRGRSAFRIRVGDYRIIYEINDSVLIVEVVELGHRREVYQ